MFTVCHVIHWCHTVILPIDEYDIDSTYNFSPNKLTRKEQEDKMKYLDKFWNKVKSDSALYLPQLEKN